MYRFVVSFLEPFTLAVVLTALALAILWRKRRESRARLLLVAVPFMALTALSMPAVAYLAASSLEYRYPPRRDRPEASDTIVVLAGGVRPPDGVRIETELGEDTLYRCLHAARLYHEGEPCLMVLAGGKVDPRRPGPTCAEAMRDFLLSQGVAESDLLLESRSRSTYENALRRPSCWKGGTSTGSFWLPMPCTCIGPRVASRPKDWKWPRRPAVIGLPILDGRHGVSCPAPAAPRVSTRRPTSGWDWGGTGCTAGSEDRPLAAFPEKTGNGHRTSLP